MGGRHECVHRLLCLKELWLIESFSNFFRAMNGIKKACRSASVERFMQVVKRTQMIKGNCWLDAVPVRAPCWKYTLIWFYIVTNAISYILPILVLAQHDDLPVNNGNSFCFVLSLLATVYASQFKLMGSFGCLSFIGHSFDYGYLFSTSSPIVAVVGRRAKNHVEAQSLSG